MPPVLARGSSVWSGGAGPHLLLLHQASNTPLFFLRRRRRIFSPALPQKVFTSLLFLIRTAEGAVRVFYGATSASSAFFGYFRAANGRRARLKSSARSAAAAFYWKEGRRESRVRKPRHGAWKRDDGAAGTRPGNRTLADRCHGPEVPTSGGI